MCKNNQDTLSYREEIVIRLLYIGWYSTKIDESILTEKTVENLITLKLVVDTPVSLCLTDKGIKLVEEGGYIIKYPMTSEDGVALDFKSILQGYSNKALHALGLSIINTQSYKKWGKHTNTSLYRLLEEAMNYYNSHESPKKRLLFYSSNLRKAQSTYEKAITTEFHKIRRFKLVGPLYLGRKTNGELIYLDEFISPTKGVIRKGSMLVPVSFKDAEYILTSQNKIDIMNMYYDGLEMAKV